MHAGKESYDVNWTVSRTPNDRYPVIASIYTHTPHHTAVCFLTWLGELLIVRKISSEILAETTLDGTKMSRFAYVKYIIRPSHCRAAVS